MKKGAVSKQKIIEVSSLLFMNQGYHKTSVSDILEATKLPKGSFYYHFKSKQELGVAVAAFYKERYEKWFEEVLERTHDFHGFVAELAADIKQQIEQEVYLGCPYTCFGTETSAIDPDIADELKKGIESFLFIFQNVFERDGLTSEKASNNAAIALGIYEGYLVYYRIARDARIIDRMVEAMLIMEVQK